MEIGFSVKQDETFRFYELTCGKQAMQIVTRRGTFCYASLCVQNASHAAFKMLGKTYHGKTPVDCLETALKNYKSAACRAMVQAAIEHERAQAAHPACCGCSDCEAVFAA